ncbi:MAG: FtsQ-type POTRA domain-containing protein [Venatoribacter sp.]
MAKKKPEPPRGATPLPKRKEKRQWQFKFPKITLPSVRISWIKLGVFSATVAVAFLLSYLGYYLYRSWPIEQLEISGNLKVWTPGQISQKLDWLRSESFASVDVELVHQQIQNLPLVKEVLVRKRWPNLIEVYVNEDEPLALWNGEFLLGSNGKLSLKPEELKLDTLLEVEGDANQTAKVIQFIADANRALGKTGVSLKRIKISTIGSVQATLSNNWVAEFGRQNTDKRLMQLGRVLSALPSEKVAKIDLRYGKGAAISWRQQEKS